jgi:hypothetical protein
MQPTPEIEAQVAEEVAKARGILENLNADNLLSSPYLVSTIYYHDGFLSGFSVDRSSADPERRIIGQISNMLSSNRKAGFMRLLLASPGTWMPNGSRPRVGAPGCGTSGTALQEVGSGRAARQ